MIDMLIGLKLTQYIDAEIEYAPWKALTNNIDYLISMLRQSRGYGNLAVSHVHLNQNNSE